jgi:hypothetical protein
VKSLKENQRSREQNLKVRDLLKTQWLRDLLPNQLKIKDGTGELPIG